MKKQDLMQRLGEITQKAEISAEIMPLREDIQDLYINLKELIMDLSLEGLQISPKIENNIEFCGCCGQKVSIKRRRIEKAMITGLLKAIHYCRQHNLKTFHKKDIKSLTPVEYTLITFLVKFGLLYKSDDMKPGEFGIPFKICREFFKGERDVLEFYEIDPTKKQGEKGYKINSESRVLFKDIPKHLDLVNQFKNTIEYLHNNNF